MAKLTQLINGRLRFRLWNEISILGEGQEAEKAEQIWAEVWVLRWK